MKINLFFEFLFKSLACLVLVFFLCSYFFVYHCCIALFGFRHLKISAIQGIHRYVAFPFNRGRSSFFKCLLFENFRIVVSRKRSEKGNPFHIFQPFLSSKVLWHFKSILFFLPTTNWYFIYLNYSLHWELLPIRAESQQLYY